MNEGNTQNYINKKIGNYVLKNEIGSGQYGKVFRGQSKLKDQTSLNVAVKCIKKNPMNQHATMRFNLEKENLIKASDHPNLVSLFDFVETNNNFYLIMELCSKGDLSKLIEQYGNQIPEYVGQKLAAQIVEGLYWLSSIDIVHRDIKPENLLLDVLGQDPIIKIADFGLSRELLPKKLAHTICGTPLYSAPEVLQGKDYNRKADIWSLGAIIYELLSGELAFDADSIEVLKQKYNDREKPKWLNISPQAKAFLEQLLEYDQSKRLDIDKVYEHE